MLLGKSPTRVTFEIPLEGYCSVLGIEGDCRIDMPRPQRCSELNTAGIVASKALVEVVSQTNVIAVRSI